jgi:hypothetical protein
VLKGRGEKCGVGEVSVKWLHCGLWQHSTTAQPRTLGAPAIAQNDGVVLLRLIVHADAAHKIGRITRILLVLASALLTSALALALALLTTTSLCSLVQARIVQRRLCTGVQGIPTQALQVHAAGDTQAARLAAWACAAVS